MDIRKAALIFFGTVFVALGVLGIFLPLMPTTVFLLLASYCYSKSSDRFHALLLGNRWCGPYIKNYKDGRGMTVSNKASTILILWLSIGFSIYLVSGGFWVNLALITIAAGVSTHLLMIKTHRPDARAELTADLETSPDN